MKRRTFIRTCIAATMAAITGTAIGTIHFFHQRFTKAKYPHRYPGQVIPLDKEKIKQPGSWRG